MTVLSWLPYLPLAFLLALAFLLPGYILARLLGGSRQLAFITAPALTLATVGVYAEVFNVLHWDWTPLSFTGALVNNVAVALFLRGCSSPRWLAPLNAYTREALGNWTPSWLNYLGLAGAALIPMIGVFSLTHATTPSSQADPLFHYAVVNAIIHTGDASHQAAALIHGVTPAPATYPTVWHAFLAILGASIPIVPASHMLAYVVIPVLWIIAVTLFFRLLLRSSTAVTFAVLFTVAIPYFPDFITTARGYWPYAIAYVGVISTLTFVLIVWRAGAARNRRSATVFGNVFALVMMGGVGLTHPGALFTVIATLIVPALVCLLRGSYSDGATAPDGAEDRTGRFTLARAQSLVFLLFAASLFLHPRVQEFLYRYHPRGGGLSAKLKTFNSEVGHAPVILVFIAALAAAALLVLIGYWLKAAYGYEQLRWTIGPLILHTVLFIGCFFDITGVSAGSALWFHDPHRIGVSIVLLLAPIFASWLTQRRRAPRTASAVALVLLLATSAATRVTIIYPNVPIPLSSGHIFKSPQHLTSIETLYTQVPAGSIVIGDPVTGIGYAPAYGPINSVFNQVNNAGGDSNGLFLAAHFNDIHTDPHVCEIIRSYGIGYFYEADSITFQRRARAETWPGLYHVDTSHGFTLVNESDGGRLWRIDVCGPTDSQAAAHWWDSAERAAKTVTVPSPPAK